VHLGIIANRSKQQVLDALPSVLQWLSNQKIDFTVASDIGDLIDLSKYDTVSPEQMRDRADVVLSFGGDGTFLQTARLMVPSGVPIVGINLGGFGYLAEVTYEQLKERIKDLISGNYVVQERMMLETYAEHDPATKFFGLNDVVIDKGGFPRAIHLETTLDDDYLNTFTADGLIVSTPTGSTGYSLSSGGPILEPSVDGMIISPISPHTLAHRPLVVCGNRCVRIKAVSEAGEVMVAVDGQRVMQLESGKAITITPAKKLTRVVVFHGYSFLWFVEEQTSMADTVQRKFGAGSIDGIV